MIIGVDAGCLSVDTNDLKAGVYYVAYYLLIELGRLDKRNTYLLYSFKPLEDEFLKKLPVNFKNIVLPSIGWMKFTLPISFLIKKPDVFLALSQAMPVYHPFRTIGFVHGLDIFPKHHEVAKSFSSLSSQTQFLIDNADVLLTTSLFLKNQLEKYYKRQDALVMPLGVDKSFSSRGNEYKNKSPYFLFVGSLKASKNIPTLIESFELFGKQHPRYDLLLIGSRRWLDPEIIPIIEKYHLQDRIHILDAVANHQLPSLYRGALALVSPAVYEGFGMPLIESMACGVPVIAGNNTAETEVVVDAGILINPKNPQEIAQAMEKMLDKTLREKLGKRGIEKAKAYSWENYAKSIHSIIVQ